MTEAARVALCSPAAREGSFPENGGDRATVARTARLHAEIAEHLRGLAAAHAELAEIQLADGAKPRLMERMPTSPAMSRLLSAQDVAEIVGVNAKTVRRWRSEGRMPEAIVIGGVARWRPEAVDRWLDERTEVGR